MFRYFYRLRMYSYAEALVRGSKRETVQRIRLQCILMQLGNELVSSPRAVGATGQPRRSLIASEFVECAALEPYSDALVSRAAVDDRLDAYRLYKRDRSVFQSRVPAAA